MLVTWPCTSAPTSTTYSPRDTRDSPARRSKYEFVQAEMRKEVAFELVADELRLDGNARQNLATFCQTWESDEVHRLMDLSINKNLIDKDEYPQAAEIERRCVHMLGHLWNCPDSHDAVGTSAIGSSEACMLAGMAMHRRWRNKRKAEGKSTDSPNFVCGPVQVVWHKFARYWDIEIREIGMAPGRYGMDAETMLAQVDENTIGVVPDARRDLHRDLRGRRRSVLRPRRPAAANRSGRRHPRRRRQRRLHRPVLRPRPGVGLPRAPGEVDQHVRPQVRARPPRRGLGALPGHRGTTRRTRVPRHLPRRRHAHVPDQLLPAGRSDHRPVLRLPPARPRRVRRGPRGRLRDSRIPGPADSRPWAHSSSSTTGIRRRASRR